MSGHAWHADFPALWKSPHWWSLPAPTEDCEGPDQHHSMKRPLWWGAWKECRENLDLLLGMHNVPSSVCLQARCSWSHEVLHHEHTEETKQGFHIPGRDKLRKQFLDYSASREYLVQPDIVEYGRTTMSQPEFKYLEWVRSCSKFRNKRNWHWWNQLANERHHLTFN